jgi:hypothetical protein
MYARHGGMYLESQLLGRPIQEDHEFKASPWNTETLLLKEGGKKNLYLFLANFGNCNISKANYFKKD